jgi:hypothetical protein
MIPNTSGPFNVNPTDIESVKSKINFILQQKGKTPEEIIRKGNNLENTFCGIT